ncbi:MAG: zinc ribbon domain-containing protein [Chloroflexota bacterium]
MDLGSIFLILALLVLVGLYVSRPLLERQPMDFVATPSNDEHERSALLAERDRVLNALQELDFDYALGKIPEADYPAQRSALLQRGADALRKLDAMRSEQLMEQDGFQLEDVPAAEDRLEAAIAARRADASLAGAGQAVRTGHGDGRKRATIVSAPDDEIERLLSDRRRSRQGKAGGFCPKCGAPVQKTDRFCPKCGTKTA